MQKSIYKVNVRSDKKMPDLSVVYGLKARLWLEMASRFDQSSADLNAAIAAEDSASIEYDKLGITTARECYGEGTHLCS